jgi:hypothetical protein
LKLECEDCGVLSEEVTHRTITHPYPEETEHVDLCGKCYEKKASIAESSVVKDAPLPAPKADIKVILQTAALQLKALKLLPLEQRISELQKFLADKPTIAPGMEPAYEAYREVLRKELDNAKAARDHVEFQLPDLSRSV